MARSRRRATQAALAMVLLVGCGGTTAPAPPTPAASIDPALLEPLLGLGPCPDPPTGLADPAVTPADLGLPVDTVITTIEDQPPLTFVEGWVELTPIQLRVSYLDRGDDVVLLSAEDEIFESELQATVGGSRVYVKAQAPCQDAAIFVAFIGPGDDPDLLPGLQGDGTVTTDE